MIHGEGRIKPEEVNPIAAQLVAAMACIVQLLSWERMDRQLALLKYWHLQFWGRQAFYSFHNFRRLLLYSLFTCFRSGFLCCDAVVAEDDTDVSVSSASS
jgi:hypothetical protein